MTLDTSRGRVAAQINVTPMIDVLLVLLIIFMLITPLAPTGLNASVPQPPPPGYQPQARWDDVVLTVRNDGAILLNQQRVERADLQYRLHDVFKANPNHVIFVRGDKDLEFRQVAQLIDIARGAGLTRVALMTTP